MSVKKCSHCGKDLPEELQFCPYCMERITEPVKVTVPTDKKKLNRKSIIIIIVAIALVLLLAVGIALFNHYKNAESDINVNNNASTEDVNTTESTSENEPVVSDDDNGTQENSTNKDASAKEENKTTNKNTSSTSSTTTTSTTNDTVNECKHNWVAITETVHHDEVGHYEDVQNKKMVTKYKCPVCYEKFTSLDEYYIHFDNTHTPSYDGDPITILKNQYTTESGYEYYTTKEWVVDEEAYDETVITGYKCSICEEEK